MSLHDRGTSDPLIEYLHLVKIVYNRHMLQYFFNKGKLLFVVDCEPGEMDDGEKCTKCPRGTYQPDRGKTACIDCPLNHTTQEVGSTKAYDCNGTL